MTRQNFILLAAVVILAGVSLVINSGAEFAGADDAITTQLESTDYKPWIAAIWEPPSAEVESFLFALQAAIGAGFIGYFYGYQQGRKKAAQPKE